MLLPCEKVARYIIPGFRSLIARELIQIHSFTQIQAANKLGTTQAAISQYVHSKRGDRNFQQFEKAIPIMRKTAAEVAERIASEEISDNEINIVFCKLCKTIHEEIKPIN
jgi:predicted transcriptional regulator